MTERNVNMIAAGVSGLLAHASSIWVAKMALTRLTGRKFDWKDAWTVAALVIVAGSWLEQGRESAVQNRERIQEVLDV